MVLGNLTTLYNTVSKETCTSTGNRNARKLCPQAGVTGLLHRLLTHVSPMSPLEKALQAESSNLCALRRRQKDSQRGAGAVRTAWPLFHRVCEGGNESE